MVVFFKYISKNGSTSYGKYIMDYTTTNIDMCKQNVKNGFTPSGKHKLKTWNLRFFEMVEVN